ncbi:MAG: hypothetical protein DRP59_10540 [Spirochaetes bacterium]|nr:MAG: hypothetical protein DRP59_10540 [Spirochaetota bacterium]
MKKIAIILMILVVGLFVVSCASKPEPAPQPSNGAENTDSGLPDFVLNPPMATDAIYGVGYAKQSTTAMSIKVAETNARADIANQIETTIQAAVTSYAQEAGVDDNTQTIKFAETITRQITDTTLNGAIVKSRVPMKDGGVWVLMVYSKDALKQSFEDTAKEFERNEDAAFAEFKADQALQKLDYQLNNNPTQSTPQK